jgi:hypothetical protein
VISARNEANETPLRELNVTCAVPQIGMRQNLPVDRSCRIAAALFGFMQ